jgi:hypothetical protein
MSKLKKMLKQAEQPGRVLYERRLNFLAALLETDEKQLEHQLSKIAKRKSWAKASRQYALPSYQILNITDY